MAIEKYVHENHIAKLSQWLSVHNLPTPDRRLFSDYGLVVDGIAIGFLYTTNSKRCLIDNIAADPNTTKEVRDRALTQLFSALENEAVKQHCLMVTALTYLPTMKNRLLERQYKPHGEFTFFYRVLGG